ncbi:MAG: ATP-dependent zinc metalloprotease FtsH [Chitinivibrionales bacterium]|nr:ATP-dependent zinc metalloprotease FtsH [Chitinivibrionales bacterium]
MNNNHKTTGTHLKKDTDRKSENRQRKPAPPPPRSLWRNPIFWILLIWVIFAIAGSNFFSNLTRATISYSTFKSQLNQNNIKSVVIKGSEIRGEFRNAYTPEEKAQGEATQEYSSFITTRPPIDDPELITLMEKNNVALEAESPDGAWWPSLMIILLPWLLIFFYFMFISRNVQKKGQNMSGLGGIFGVGKSRARRFRESKTRTTYNDVAGLENPKRDLQEIVSYLKDPKKFTSLGAQIPKGVLLMGPPGTGKTLLARATAGEANVPFYSISGSEFIEMFVGVGASRVRDMFANAKKEAPSIIFIDEIDSVGRSRGAGLGGGHDEREQTLNQILSEMDGFEPHESVIVIAATNRPDVLDSALIRPGRFDRQITLELPQKNARRNILQLHMRHVPAGEDVDLDITAARTVGFSGADLHNLVNEAALLAGRKDKKKVTAEDFDEASDKIILGAEREDVITEEEKKVIAYHEAGHALTAKLLPGTDPLQKVTIIPRGRSLGATQQIPEIDRHNYNQSYLQNRICVALGGRTSERLIFNELTTGAAQDLKAVTQLVRKMICQWGMSDKLGPVTYNLGEEHLFLGRELSQSKNFSEDTARAIDEEVRRIIHDMEDKTMNILNKNRGKLDVLATRLMENETLFKDDIERILADGKGQVQQHSV